MSPNNNPQFYTWRPDFRQNPFLIVRSQVDGEVQDIRVNRTPLKTDYLDRDVRVIATPRVVQNKTDIQKGDSVAYGVGAPGSLYARLNTSLVGTQEEGK